MARRSLAEINDREPYITDWNDKYITQSVTAVGSVGFRRSGEKNHMVSAQVIVALVDGFEPQRNQYQLGDVFSASARCNGNGQNVAVPDRRLDTDAVNCGKCAKNLD